MREENQIREKGGGIESKFMEEYTPLEKEETKTKIGNEKKNGDSLQIIGWNATPRSNWYLFIILAVYGRAKNSKQKLCLAHPQLAV